MRVTGTEPGFLPAVEVSLYAFRLLDAKDFVMGQLFLQPLAHRADPDGEEQNTLITDRDGSRLHNEVRLNEPGGLLLAG
jgi:hypothetical protein